VQYLLHNTEDNALEFRYEATTDAPTPINLTNHTYWNLNGFTGTVHDHKMLMKNCSKYLPVTPTQIPTGEQRSVVGTSWLPLQRYSRHGVVYVLVFVDGCTERPQPLLEATCQSWRVCPHVLF
jgi:galactose mutarotase-like enzyme